jgi:hypothetical protein
MSADHTRLKGVESYGRSLVSDQLEANLVSFFQWGLLGVGAFNNAYLATSGAYGGQWARLRLSEDPNYSGGQVWEGARQDWVWETGVDWTTQPIRVSGVYVNGTFYGPAATGGWSHHVNYPLGRVVFDAPIPTGSVVQCEHSWRLTSLTTADAPWWRQVHPHSQRVDSPEFLQYGSGLWSILAQNRVQLPHVIVEATPIVQRRPYEIGNLTQVVSQVVDFHVLAETHWDRKQLHDVIMAQQEKRVIFFDKNDVFAAATGAPLDGNGSPASGGMMYPDLVKPSGEGGFGWRVATLKEMASERGEGKKRGGIWECTVHGLVELELP